MNKDAFLASTALASLLMAGLVMTSTASFAQDVGQQNGNSSLETVTVTAEKKDERLLDTPVPVTVLSGDNLASNNETKVQDYLASVPGLSMSPGASYAGGTMIEIRGLGTSQYTNGSAPTVGYLIDGVPYGPSEVIQFANGNPGFPDIDPSDISRIEVLKGPQGTLYGADSIGGVINIITKNPTFDGFNGHVQALEEVIPNGGSGYALRGAANIPLSDDLAVRVSAFDRLDPGYIDDVTTGQKNVNSAAVYGAHTSVLYQPLENLSFKLSALYQDNDSHGLSVINTDKNLQPQFSGLQVSGLPGTGNNKFLTEALSGVINANFWGIDAVSTTGYNIDKNQHNEDFTGGFGPLINQPPSPFASTAPHGSVFASNYTTEKFSQELRLSSSFGKWIDWMVGGFYTHEATHGVSLITANNLATGAYQGTYFTETSGNFGQPATTLTEESVFGNLTANITDQFDIQVGGRESWYQQAFNNTNFGPGFGAFGFGTAQPTVTPTLKGSDSAFTWLVTPEYKLSSDLMVYARIATGYEIGGTNNPGALVSTFGPSNTTNYEVGTKGTFADGKVSFDLSAYYIDWKDIQFNEIVGFIGFVGNGGQAKSQGVEASIQARPIDDLRITANASYNDARLTTAFPATATVPEPAGTQLPYSTPYTASLGADWDFMHFDDATAFVGATLNYVGKHPGEFDGFDGFPRLNFAAYTTVNSRIGVRGGLFDVNLYVNNLFDDHGYVGGEGDFGGALGNSGGYYAQPVQPRTIGLSLTKDF